MRLLLFSSQSVSHINCFIQTLHTSDSVFRISSSSHLYPDSLHPPFSAPFDVSPFSHSSSPFPPRPLFFFLYLFLFLKYFLHLDTLTIVPCASVCLHIQYQNCVGTEFSDCWEQRHVFIYYILSGFFWYCVGTVY